MKQTIIFDYAQLQSALTPKLSYGTITGDMNLVQEVESVKQELVDLIIQQLKENKIDVQKARKLATDFLAILPIRDQQDLLLKLKNLGDQYAEARGIYVQEMGRINEEKRHQALSQMHVLIQQGKLEEAISVAKQMQSS